MLLTLLYISKQLIGAESLVTESIYAREKHCIESDLIDKNAAWSLRVALINPPSRGINQPVGELQYMKDGDARRTC